MPYISKDAAVEPLRSSWFVPHEEICTTQSSQCCTGVVAAGAELRSSPAPFCTGDKGVSCASNGFHPGSEVKTPWEKPQFHIVTLQRLKIETQVTVTTKIQGEGLAQQA